MKTVLAIVVTTTVRTFFFSYLFLNQLVFAFLVFILLLVSLTYSENISELSRSFFSAALIVLFKGWSCNVLLNSYFSINLVQVHIFWLLLLKLRTVLYRQTIPNNFVRNELKKLIYSG